MSHIPPTHAFLLTIDGTDSQGDVVQTVKGANSLLSLIEGREEFGTAPNTWFTRYVLKPSLLPIGTPEITVMALVGINQTVPNVVRREYAQNTIFWRTIEFFGYTPAPTRAQMQARLRQEIGFEGVTHVWEVVPGADLGGALLPHFLPL